MLVIRKEQMDIFSRHMLKQFEDLMANHLRSRFPEQTRDISEPDLRNLINDGIDKDETYNITIEDNVQRYLEYIVTYGSDFDTNPETSWAGDILRMEDLDGTRKRDRLNEYALTFEGRT